MEINAKKGEFVELANGLYKVQELKGKEFGLVVSKNIKTIQSSLKELEDASQPSAEFKKLAIQIQEIVANEGDDSIKIKSLEEEHKELIESRKQQIADIQLTLNEEIKLELFPIKENILPEDITGEQILGIDKIIE
jgi:hypothetical protein